MTITTSVNHDVRRDEQVDIRVDVQTDGRKAGGQAGDGLRSADGFVIALVNHKGGVTKTTSTANLGATFAEAGRRVLIVDCDPQANLSEAFGWAEELPGERLEDLSRTRKPPVATPHRQRSSRTSRRGSSGGTGCGSSRRLMRSPMLRRTCR
jgi:AAA domain